MENRKKGLFCHLTLLKDYGNRRLLRLIYGMIGLAPPASFISARKSSIPLIDPYHTGRPPAFSHDALLVVP